MRTQSCQMQVMITHHPRPTVVIRQLAIRWFRRSAGISVWITNICMLTMTMAVTLVVT
jgi:hypothetical protein